MCRLQKRHYIIPNASIPPPVISKFIPKLKLKPADRAVSAGIGFDRRDVSLSQSCRKVKILKNSMTYAHKYGHSKISSFY